MKGGAQFSRDGKRRLVLWRRWGVGPKALWLGLNPSKAGALGQEDQSTRKIRGFSERIGCGAYVLMNLFDLVSTDPRGLRGLPLGELVSPANDARVLSFARECRYVVACWGRHGALHGRGMAMRRFLEERGVRLLALYVNADGSPAHPLMLPYHLRPVPFVMEKERQHG